MSALPVPSRRTAVRVAVVSAAVVALLGLLVDAAWPPLLRVDAAIEDAVHGWAVNAPWAVDLSRTLDRIGRFSVSFWVTTVCVLVLLAFRRWRRHPHEWAGSRLWHKAWARSRHRMTFVNSSSVCVIASDPRRPSSRSVAKPLAARS